MLCRHPQNSHSPGINTPECPQASAQNPIKKPQTTRNAKGRLQSPHPSPHQSPRGAKSGGLSTTCTPPGLSWGFSPGFSWGAVLGQAQRRGGMNCPLGSFPLLPKAVRVQSGGSSPEVLRSAELLSPSAVRGLRVTACPQVRGEPQVEGPGFGTAGAPHPAPSTHWSPAAGPGQPQLVPRAMLLRPEPPAPPRPRGP